MAIFRLILLVAVMGGLTLLLTQNWSPVLPVVFLGMQTKPLPLAILILFSIAAGAATSLLISALFRVSGYFAAPQRPTPSASKSRRTQPSGDRSFRERSTDSYSYTSYPSSANQTSSQANSDDDWESDNNDDWDFAEKPEPTPPRNKEVRDSTIYERQQEPKDSFRSGSSYSYSYREPKNSGVGKTESIYDADYRVIIPPYQPSSDDLNDQENQTEQNNQTNEDDWGFLDDFEDDDQRPRK